MLGIKRDVIWRDEGPGLVFLTGKLVGKRAGVHAYPHKFRHMGATMFLRNGGNVFELKEILGHSTMEMVQRYVHLAQADIEEAHRRASPVHNWDLRY